MSNYLITRIVAAAVQVSRRAARIIRDIKISGSLETKEKGKNDYVTKADFQSQMCIIRSLENMFPKIVFCGEEGDLKGEFNDLETTISNDVLNIASNDQIDKLCSDYKTIKEEDLVIWVDPLDGTKEYTMSEEYANEVTILIGIAYAGRAIAGVVNQPFYTRNIHDQNGDRVLWAIDGLGAYHNSNNRSVFEQLKSREKKLAELESSKNSKYKIITTRSHLNDIVKRGLNDIKNSEVSYHGGSGYKTLCVIEGIADCYLYPRNGTKRWDTCAPEAILNAIGGQFTDVFNKKYDYSATYDKIIVENSCGIVASLIEHEYFINSLSKELLDDVLKIHNRLHGSAQASKGGKNDQKKD